MNIRSYLLVILIVAVGTVGCGKRTSSARGMSRDRIGSLESELHLELPEKLSLIKSSDGGGRDAHYGFHKWVLYGPTGIPFTPRDGTTVEYHWERQPAPPDIVEWVSYEVRESQLPRATGVLTVRWKADKYVYDAELLRTERGDYMVIQRFTAPPETEGS